VPVIAAKVGNFSEIIDDKINGLLVNYNNRQQLAVLIDQLLSDESLARQLSNEGKQKAKMFSIDRTIDELSNKIRICAS
jgi:glycosyltransferase involved in cell wall biosynthesis